MFRRLLSALAASVLVVAALVHPALARADEFTISAAISLKSALEKARPELEKAAGMPVQFNYGASGTLCAQILRGAPVDLFISADTQNVETLKKENATLAGTEKILVRNDLVLVTPANAPAIKALSDLGGDSLKKLAIGEPKIVPAGKYAQQTLTHLELYEGLQRANKLVMGENVAQVLAYVERGEVDAGLVYRTDARNSAKVLIADVAPDSSHEPIVYVMTILREAPHTAAAHKVQERLLSPEVQTLLGSFGFKPAIAAEAPKK